MGRRSGRLVCALAAIALSAAPAASAPSAPSVPSAPSAIAEEPADTTCDGFRWDMTNELNLFRSTGAPLTAATDAASAPAVAPDRLFEITLTDQSTVRFAATPAAQRRVDAPSAGLVWITVPAPGHYRLSASGPVWIDVLDGASVIPASDFNGHPRCALVHKSVDYAFATAGRFLVQLSQSPAARVRLALTRAPAAP